MKAILLTLLFCSLSILVMADEPKSIKVDQEPLRTWHSVQSGRQMEATLVAVKGDEITVERHDGRVFKLWMIDVSNDDVNYVRNVVNAISKPRRDATREAALRPNALIDKVLNDLVESLRTAQKQSLTTLASEALRKRQKEAALAKLNGKPAKLIAVVEDVSKQRQIANFIDATIAAAEDNSNAVFMTYHLQSVNATKPVSQQIKLPENAIDWQGIKKGTLVEFSCVVGNHKKAIGYTAIFTELPVTETDIETFRIGLAVISVRVVP